MGTGVKSKSGSETSDSVFQSSALIFDDRPSDLALLKSWTAPSRSPISCWEFEERGLGSQEESAVEMMFARASSLASSRSAMAIAVVIYQ